MPLNIKPVTEYILLNCNMVDQLVETQIDPKKAAVLNSDTIKKQRESTAHIYSEKLKKLHDINLENLVENYKSNYREIASDLSKINNHVKENDHKVLEVNMLTISAKINGLINKKLEAEKGHFLKNFWNRTVHLFTLRGFNTEGEYAQKQLMELEKTKKMERFKLLNKWDGTSLENPNIRMAIQSLSLSEIEAGAGKELFKLKEEHYVANQFNIINLFDSVEKKKAFLKGIAKRDDALTQVLNIIGYNTGYNRTDPKYLIEFHKLAENTGIETKILNDFMRMHKLKEGGDRLSNSDELAIFQITRNDTPEKAGILKQYFVELLIHKAAESNNFNFIADILDFESNNKSHFNLKKLMGEIFHRSSVEQDEPQLILLTDRDLQSFKDNVKREAFDVAPKTSSNSSKIILPPEEGW